MSTGITVFVCGTFNGLSDERTVVIDAIRRLQLEHDSMEFFGAPATSGGWVGGRRPRLTDDERFKEVSAPV